MTLVQFCTFKTHAYILPLEHILQKNASLAGSGVLSVEQDVIFTEAGKSYLVKEIWLIEGDRNLKLIARGQGDLLAAVNLTYLYNNKNRTQLVGKNRVVKPAGADFFEKFLAIKSRDTYASYFKELSIDSQVRLSRAAGRICFAVGAPSEASQAKPQIWFEQESFRLAKIRFPSLSEVEFNDYQENGNIHYPRSKIVLSKGQNIKINVTKFGPSKSASLKDFYPAALESSSALNTSQLDSVSFQIEDFYSRFR